MGGLADVNGNTNATPPILPDQANTHAEDALIGTQPPPNPVETAMMLTVMG
jgi:hypothetical protein